MMMRRWKIEAVFIARIVMLRVNRQTLGSLQQLLSQQMGFVAMRWLVNAVAPAQSARQPNEIIRHRQVLLPHLRHLHAGLFELLLDRHPLTLLGANAALSRLLRLAKTRRFDTQLLSQVVDLLKKEKESEINGLL